MPSCNSCTTPAWLQADRRQKTWQLISLLLTIRYTRRTLEVDLNETPSWKIFAIGYFASHNQVHKKIIRSGPKCKSLSRIWNRPKSDPPIKHPKTTQINSSLSHHHHLAVNFSAWQLHTEHSPAKDSSACNCSKTLKKS